MNVLFFSLAIAACLVSGLAKAGTFTVRQLTVTVTPNDTTTDHSLNTHVGSSLSLFTGQVYSKAMEVKTGPWEGVLNTSVKLSVKYKWRIEYIPSGPGDVPNPNGYICAVEERQKAKAWANSLLTPENMSGVAEGNVSVSPGATSPLTFWGTTYSYIDPYDFFTPRTVNTSEGAIEEAGDTNVPWMYTGTIYAPGVVFALNANGKWIGNAQCIDLTPEMHFYLQLDNTVTDLDKVELAGYIKKQQHLNQVGSQLVDSPWTR